MIPCAELTLRGAGGGEVELTLRGSGAGAVELTLREAVAAMPRKKKSIFQWVLLVAVCISSASAAVPQNGKRQTNQ